MSSDTVADLPSLFRSAVESLAAVDEPWIALSVLAMSDLRKPPARTQRSKDDLVETWQRALEKLTKLELRTHAAAIISRNDVLEDIATESLKFVLVPFLFSRLHSAFSGDQAERLDHLQKSKASLVDFFSSLDNIGLLDTDTRDQVLDDTVQVVRTPQQRRDEKILRFKAERAAERKLSEIVERRVTHSYSVEEDEETLRDCTLTIIQSAVRKGLDSLSFIDQEIELLNFARKARSKGMDPRKKSAQARKNAPATVIDGMPPTFKIVNNREEKRKQVFRPSHSLPTYTVEEWGEIELANAAKKEQEKRSADVVKARQAAEEDSDGDEAANRETMEKRSWDNWRDENNRGTGNTSR